jgi:hypothetical protein
MMIIDDYNRRIVHRTRTRELLQPAARYVYAICNCQAPGTRQAETETILAGGSLFFPVGCVARGARPAHASLFPLPLSVSVAFVGVGGSDQTHPTSCMQLVMAGAGAAGERGGGGGGGRRRD